MEVGEVGMDDQIGIEARRLDADGDLARFQDQPQTAAGSTAKVELDGCACRRQANKANVLRSASVALRMCTVSFTGSSGIRHSIDVTVESVCEAAALGISALRKSGWTDTAALGTEFEIQVREPAPATGSRFSSYIAGAMAPR